MPFNFKKTTIKDLLIIELQKFGDHRGFFIERYKKADFLTCGITEDFVQDNHSFSNKGVLRGIHFQAAPMEQGKLVQVISGAVWDVAVYLRQDSPTFGKWYGTALSGKNCLGIYIPAGFGHGFVTLEDNTHFFYKCTNCYSPEHECGIRWNDPILNIKWPLSDVVISEKDNKLPYFEETMV
ncbi:dTDP-4-dehydrorhamnose 3,5-epimerase [Chitinispirillum alkaliphilum]|nr:dTDP-4-dehydrorhamnose 3,5-epimerase [Chitinispirillum alkaliphilum]